MKTIKKTIYMLLCVFVLSTAAGLACLFMPTNAFTFADTGVTADLYMEEGASVRTDRAGVRFRTYIKKTYYDGLTEPETGIFVIPSDLLDGELNETTVKAKNIVSMADPLTDGDYYVFSNVLTQIPENSYGRALTARSYVKVNGEYIFADNPQTRSLAYVSQAALYADSGLEESDKTALCGYVDSAVQSFTAPSDAITLSDVAALNLSVVPVYGEDDLSNLLIPVVSSNPAAVTVNNGNITPVSAGLSEITATLGSRSVTFGAIVNGDNQDIVMTDSTHSLALSIPDGCTVSSITCKEESWGNDLSALTVSDTLKETKTGHGETTAQVVVNGSKSYTLTVPVTLVTAIISNVEQWQKNIVLQTVTDAINGYYVLSNSFSASTIGTTLKPGASNAMKVGFLGTLDGRGNAVTIEKDGTTGLGIFGVLGVNSMIKNLIINNNTAKNPGWNSNITLAQVATQSKLQDVTININNANHSSGTRYGALTHEGIVNCEFLRLTVNIDGKVESFAGGNNNSLSLQGNKFENCVINLMTESSSLTEVGHLGTTIYVAKGMSTDGGENELTGIKLNAVKSETVDTNYFVITESVHSLDLGKYSSGYTVQSITSGGTDLGTDVSNVALSGSTAGSSGSISVVLKNDSGVVNLTVPVIWVTAKIATAEDWKTYMWMDKGTSKTGYYVLANDIHVTENVLNNTVSGSNAETSTTSGEYGFRGTLDGRGYEFKFDYTVGGGLVNALGTGAIVKDIIITNNSKVAPGWKANHIFGAVAVGTTFQNVTINLLDCNYATTDTKYGPLTYDGFRNCTVTNLTVNITGNVNTIVGGGNATYFQIVGTTFKNCVVNLLGGATLGEVAHTGETIYCGSNQTIDGQTPLEGFTVNQVAAETETLSERQDVSLAAESFSLNLGAYSDYNVKSIAYGEDIIGNDVSNVVITEEIKKKSF